MLGVGGIEETPPVKELFKVVGSIVPFKYGQSLW